MYFNNFFVILPIRRLGLFTRRFVLLFSFFLNSLLLFFSRNLWMKRILFLSIRIFLYLSAAADYSRDILTKSRRGDELFYTFRFRTDNFCFWWRTYRRSAKLQTRTSYTDASRKIKIAKFTFLSSNLKNDNFVFLLFFINISLKMNVF